MDEKGCMLLREVSPWERIHEAWLINGIHLQKNDVFL